MTMPRLNTCSCRLLPDQEVHEDIRRYTNPEQSGNDSKPEKILGRVMAWEEVTAIDLSKVAWTLLA